MRHAAAPYCPVTLGTITINQPVILNATVVPANVTG